MKRLYLLWLHSPVQFKFLSLVTPLVLICLVGTVAFLGSRAREAALERQVAEFEVIAEATAETLANAYWNYNLTRADSVIESLDLLPNLVTAKAWEIQDGEVVADSTLNRELLREDTAAFVDHPFTRIARKPIVFDDQGTLHFLGELEISHTLQALETETQNQLYMAVLASCIGALALIVGAAIALSQLILKPVAAVAESSRGSAKSLEEMAEESFEPVVWNSRDQMGRLVRDYNTLRESQIAHAGTLKSQTVELQELGEEASKARDAAIEANESKSRFLATMTHELRTPLNSIIGLTDVMSQNAGRLSEAKMTQSLKRVGDSGRHLLSLINEILDLSKMEAGKLDVTIAPLDLLSTLQEATDLSETLIQQNLNTLTLDLPRGPHMVMADPVRLKQILLNLLSNAAKFTKEGDVTVRVTPDGDDFILDVKDTGIGLTQEQQSRLFQDFEQAEASTARRFGGTGLGLSISRRLARAMHGDITVASEYGAGATFTLRLPAQPKDTT